VELAQLEAQVSTDEYQLVTAQTALQNYKLQLKQLLELDCADEMNVQIVEIDDASVLATLPDKLDVYEAALAQRPEIQSSKLNIESAALGVKVAKAGYIPTVSMTAGIGTNHTTGSDFTFTEQVKNGWNNTAGLSVSVPIFNNRQTKSAVQKAKLQQETSQLDLQDKQKALYKSIEGYWLEAVNSQQRYAAAEKKQQSAQTSFELVSQQFDLGMKNIVELLTEKNTLLSARQETLQAKYMAVLNAQLLKFYQGEKVEL
jgi:outer membrane protein